LELTQPFWGVNSDVASKQVLNPVAEFTLGLDVVAVEVTRPQEFLLSRRALKMVAAMSSHRAQIDRVWNRISKINRRVDPAGVLLDLDEFPEKPPPVRWTTYLRLQERHGALADRLALHSMIRLFRGLSSRR
jgi:hypothetical protein